MTLLHCLVGLGAAGPTAPLTVGAINAGGPHHQHAAFSSSPGKEAVR